MNLSDRTRLKVEPFSLSQVRLHGGILKERQDVHARYLMMIEPDRMLASFRLQAGLPPKAERYGGWESRDISGHSLGHYLSALCLLFAIKRLEVRPGLHLLQSMFPMADPPTA
jgi:DUF1680 family protein